VITPHRRRHRRRRGSGSGSADQSSVDRLGELVENLANESDDCGQCRWLADTVYQYRHDAAINLPMLEHATPEVESLGLDIGV
jgi:hypothetical protein